MTEEWRLVTVSQDYEVSSAGRVRSKPRRILMVNGRTRTIAGGILKPGFTDGYPTVRIHGKVYKIHRLVAFAFLRTPAAGEQVCHFDGDRLNNSVTNLRWDTARANSADKKRHGTDWQLRKTACPAGHRYSSDNTYLAPDGSRRCRACARSAKGTRRADMANRLKTHCFQGHEFSTDNTYVTPTGARRCRECERARDRARVRAR